MAADEGPVPGSPLPDPLWSDIFEDLSPHNHCSLDGPSSAVKAQAEVREEEKAVPPIPPAAVEPTFTPPRLVPARVANVGARWKRVKEMSDSIASTAYFAMTRRITPQETQRLGQMATEMYHELLSIRDSTLPPVPPLPPQAIWSSSLPSPVAFPALRPQQEIILPAYLPVPRKQAPTTWVTEDKPRSKRKRRSKTCEHSKMPGACSECSALEAEESANERIH